MNKKNIEIKLKATDIPRFFARVAKLSDSECWEWTGYKRRTHIKSESGYSCGGGYGRMSIRISRNNHTHAYVHRIAWVIANGPIPEGMTVDHICFNRSCVNPSHLRLLPHAMNCSIKRGNRRNSSSARKGA